MSQRVKRTGIAEMGFEPGVANSIRFDGHLVPDKGAHLSGTFTFAIHGEKVTHSVASLIGGGDGVSRRGSAGVIKRDGGRERRNE